MCKHYFNLTAGKGVAFIYLHITSLLTSWLYFLLIISIYKVEIKGVRYM